MKRTWAYGGAVAFAKVLERETSNPQDFAGIKNELWNRRSG